mgnify:CR=1 FL=1
MTLDILTVQKTAVVFGQVLIGVVHRIEVFEVCGWHRVCFVIYTKFDLD